MVKIIHMNRDDYNPPETPEQHEEFMLHAGICGFVSLLAAIAIVVAKIQGWF